MLQEGRKFESVGGLGHRDGLGDFLGASHLGDARLLPELARRAVSGAVAAVGDNVILSTAATTGYEWIGDGARLTLHAAEAASPVPG